MTCGLVHASYSLPEWQAVKLTFFAPWSARKATMQRNTSKRGHKEPCNSPRASRVSLTRHCSTVFETGLKESFVLKVYRSKLILMPIQKLICLPLAKDVSVTKLLVSRFISKTRWSPTVVALVRSHHFEPPPDFPDCVSSTRSHDYDVGKKFSTAQIESPPRGVLPMYGLYRYVPLWRVWFSSSLLWDRVYKSERLGLE